MLSVIAKIKVIENVRVDPDAGPSLNSNNFTPQLLASGLLPKRKEQIMNKIRLIYKRLGNGKGENQGSHLRRVEIYKWFLRSEINKADINSVKNVLNAAFLEVRWTSGNPCWSHNNQGSQKICFIHTSLEKFKNLEGKVENEKFNLKAPGAMILQSS